MKKIGVKADKVQAKMTSSTCEGLLKGGHPYTEESRKGQKDIKTIWGDQQT